MVILGSGWAAAALLKKLEGESYDVTVISPTNYFLFTPLLPSAITGTVESRSLMESVRKICLSTKANYIEGKADDVNLKDKILRVVSNEGDSFEVPYSKLVIAVGAENNTFGIRGVKGMECI